MTSFQTSSTVGHSAMPLVWAYEALVAGGLSLRSKSATLLSRRSVIIQIVLSRSHTLLQEVDVQLLHETRIAPSQTRTVPILLSQTKGFTGLGLPLTISVISERGTIVFFINLPLKHIARWDATSFIPVISTYFFSGSIPAAFVAVPPKERNPNKAVPPLLFLRTWLCDSSACLAAH